MLVLSGHILLSSMELMGMESVHDIPSDSLFPSDLSDLSKEDRKEVLSQIVRVIVHSYVDISTIRYQTPHASEW